MSEINRAQLSLIRKYIFEVVLVVLCFVVSFLGKMVFDLQDQIVNYWRDTAVNLTKVVEENTRVMRYYQPQEIPEK